MRQVVGNRIVDLPAAGFAARRDDHDHLLLDLGTGDGKHVLALARARPDTLVVGVDASPDRMRKASRRGGPSNALFLQAAAEALPDGLDGIGELHVLMPWGSLLRAVVTPDVAVLGGIGTRCVAGATFLVTLNLHAWRPPVPEVGGTAEPTPDTAGLTGTGWDVERVWYPDESEIAALATSWTRRLGATRDELAVLALAGTTGAPGTQEGNWRQYS